MSGLDLPERCWQQLTAGQLAVANALSNKHRRQHWLAEAARPGAEHPRAFCVELARSAHRAYLLDLKRAAQYARHGAFR